MSIVDRPLKKPFEVLLKQSFEDKLRYLCNSIPDVEWSGILLFEPVGSIRDMENFSIVLKDVIPLDIGTAGATSYSNFEQLLEYFDEPGNENAEKDYQEGKLIIGHIHSHNHMDVFFSTTDVNELADNAPNHNYYVSFIVNNKMDFSCRIAIHSKIREIIITKDECGHDIETILEKELVYSYKDALIRTERSAMNVPMVFAERVEKLLKNRVSSYMHKGRELNSVYSSSFQRNKYPKSEQLALHDEVADESGFLFYPQHSGHPMYDMEEVDFPDLVKEKKETTDFLDKLVCMSLGKDNLYFVTNEEYMTVLNNQREVVKHLIPLFVSITTDWANPKDFSKYLQDPVLVIEERYPRLKFERFLKERLLPVLKQEPDWEHLKDYVNQILYSDERVVKEFFSRLYNSAPEESSDNRREPAKQKKEKTRRSK